MRVSGVSGKAGCGWVGCGDGERAERGGPGGAAWAGALAVACSAQSCEGRPEPSARGSWEGTRGRSFTGP